MMKRLPLADISRHSSKSCCYSITDQGTISSCGTVRARAFSWHDFNRMYGFCFARRINNVLHYGSTE